MPLLVLALLATGCGRGRSSPEPAAGEGRTDRAAAGLQVPEAGWKTDFAKHTVQLDEFQSGGPGKDGIPALGDPDLVSVTTADTWLAPPRACDRAREKSFA